jgi:hypothetical protein
MCPIWEEYLPIFSLWLVRGQGVLSGIPEVGLFDLAIAFNLGVIRKLNIIIKRKTILLYLFFILVGSIIPGYSYDFLLNFLAR